jgi:hypothetical protein
MLSPSSASFCASSPPSERVDHAARVIEIVSESETVRPLRSNAKTSSTRRRDASPAALREIRHPRPERFVRYEGPVDEKE